MMADGPGVDKILFFSMIKIEFYSDVKDLLVVSRGCRCPISSRGGGELPQVSVAVLVSHWHFRSLPVESSILVFWSWKGLRGGTRSVCRCPGSTVGPSLCLCREGTAGLVLSCQAEVTC